MSQNFRSFLPGVVGLSLVVSVSGFAQAVGDEGPTGVAEAVRAEATPALQLPTRLSFGENGWVSVGARLQTLFIYNDSDLVGDTVEFRLRRARVFVRGEVTEWAGFSFATEVSGSNVTLIDAFFHLKPKEETQVFLGRHLSPGTGRQAGTTSAAAMMAIDRPAFAFKNLSYGARAMTAFSTSTLPGTDSGIRMDAQVRDEGVTVWGDHFRGEDMHLKYYVGIYDGWSRSPSRDEGDLRYSGRASINYGDHEKGYFNSSTYLGNKRTIGVGVSVDAQNRVATEQGTQRGVDYRFWTVDLFLEQPLTAGVVNFEAAYGQLDLDDAGLLLDRNGNPLGGSAVSGQQAQGDGFFLQAGYYFPDVRVQPWVLYEEWSSDAAGGLGSYNSGRVGLTYFARGHNLNFKIGFERTRLDGSPGGDRVSNSVVVGAYLNF